MAQDRAIKPYIVDWNIFVSEGYKQAYDPSAHSDADGAGGDATLTEESKRYNRECITQAINEYPDLAGLGLSMGDRVNNLDLTGQVQWADDVIIAGVLNASRPIDLLYRAPFGEGPGSSNDPKVARAHIEKSKLQTNRTFLQLKFDWSHAHSTTKLVHVHGGGRGEAYWDPPPSRYSVTWMVRNEDFFFLRWGEADFIRRHIAENGHAFVGGYAVGSEGLIPAYEYAEQPGSQTWSYMFERQWLFYMLWGRLLYDPTTPDSVFADAFDTKYGTSSCGGNMLSALQHASRMPLRLTSLIYNTWDFTFHAEGFLLPVGNPDKAARGFISVETLLRTKVLDPGLQSVSDFVAAPNASLTSPLQLAADLQADGEAALAAVSAAPAQLAAEVVDVRTWARLSLYTAHKLRGAVALQKFRTGGAAAEQAAAIGNLTDAVAEWAAVVNLTSSHLRPDIPLMDLAAKTFSWADYADMVARDVSIARAGLCGAEEAALCPGLAGSAAACEACVQANGKALKQAGCFGDGGEGGFIDAWCSLRS